MAARLRVRHQDEIRTKIQTSQLINVLQNHALGLNDAEITPTRMKAIEILLRKSMPDLSQVDGSGDDGEHLHIVERIVREVIDPKSDVNPID